MPVARPPILAARRPKTKKPDGSTRMKNALTCTLLSCIACIAMAHAAETAKPQTGLIRHERGAFEGFTLFAPLRSTTTYLIDMDGRTVHTWPSRFPPGQAVYLLENGQLLHTGHDPRQRAFHGGGVGGRIEELDWDGNCVWEYVYADDNHCQHHDIAPLPNGNVLILAWERKTKDEAIAAGRDPGTLAADELWPDHVVEIKPEGRSGGTIVWAWHVWDHLVQDFDKSKANYAPVAQHPELIDINYVGRSMRLKPDAIARLRALGYITGPEHSDRNDSGRSERDDTRRRRGPGGPGGFGGPGADWNHTNAVDYNRELDQIALSVLGFNEIWVIDHSTTTEQAAGHTGGRYGKGGDLLYRWGNPQAYRAGSNVEQQLFAQHDARWIPPGSPGAGNLLVFNNGRGRPDGSYSSVDQIAPPLTKGRTYEYDPAHGFGPAAGAWTYTSPSRSDFFSGHISGAERLPNGNTLICSGEQGRLFEVDPKGRIVWEYVNPFEGNIGSPAGPPGFLRSLFGGPDGPPPDDNENRGNGNAARERRRPERRPHRNDVRDAQPRRGRRPPPGGFGGPPPGPGRGPRGSPGGGPGEQGNALFRATRYAPDYPGLAGRDLSPANRVANTRN
jgi:hypothetical protein